MRHYHRSSSQAARSRPSCGTARILRNLLTAEAQRDPYVWAAVLLAHFALGTMLWLVLGLWAVATYAAFEALQACYSGAALWWDSVLDWCGVALGVAFAVFLWGHNGGEAAACAVAILCIAAVGHTARS